MALSTTVSSVPSIPWALFLQQIKCYVPVETAVKWTLSADITSDRGLEVRNALLRLLNKRSLEGITKLQDVPKPVWIDQRNCGHFFGSMKLCDTLVNDQERTMLSLS
jgi:hypothetical protein